MIIPYNLSKYLQTLLNYTREEHQKNDTPYFKDLFTDKIVYENMYSAKLLVCTGVMTAYIIGLLYDENGVIVSCTTDKSRKLESCHSVEYKDDTYFVEVVSSITNTSDDINNHNMEINTPKEEQDSFLCNIKLERD